MIHLSFSRALLIVFSLSTWTIGETENCGDDQYEKYGRCCKKCEAGTYMKDFCSQTRETVCIACPEGTYAEYINAFDHCEKCPSCQQGFAENCTKTTKGNCQCRPGFLCSDKSCSLCEENKCSAGEKPIKTELENGNYSYDCEFKCRENHFFDAEEDTCKPWTQCGAKGLVEKIPGSKTHDAVCIDPQRDGSDYGNAHWIMSIGFVFLSLTLFLFMFYACSKKLRRNQKNSVASKISVQAVSSKTSDFHLSKEESGLKLIIQDELKDCCSVTHLDSSLFHQDISCSF
ncbi:PREDICTED: tumor necrosis factor receptor superfamily member 9 [Poecilia mexicana]|uniref:TNFR-Cys domain-containing protein n=1 Tax=Poecilia mexicana TaxID=48701 RepID=A0A3B3WXF0_9TELE|nr:PREDICTED: tumor necrosis factor receptor superfamily member 9 [Poecilia mexicana]